MAEDKEDKEKKSVSTLKKYFEEQQQQQKASIPSKVNISPRKPLLSEIKTPSPVQQPIHTNVVDTQKLMNVYRGPHSRPVSLAMTQQSPISLVHERKIIPPKPVKPAHLAFNQVSSPLMNPFESILSASHKNPFEETTPIIPTRVKTPSKTRAQQPVKLSTAASPTFNNKITKQISQEDLKRGQIIHEMVESEQIFLSDMQVLLEVMFYYIYK